MRAKAAQDVRELPLMNAFIEAGYFQHGDRLFKKNFIAVLNRNRENMCNVRLSALSTKADFDEALTSRIQYGTLRLIHL